MSLAFLAHRVLAAFKAISLRRSAVIVSIRLLPPIFPPFCPILAITREISLRDMDGSFFSVLSLTNWLASWFISFGLLGLLMRFGIP